MDYWSFVDPVWYGGFPFSYATLDLGQYWNPYYGSNLHAYGQFDDGLLIVDGNVQVLADTPFFAAARAQFYAGNYQESLRDVQHATIDMPGSPYLQEFHALVLFALGEYQTEFVWSYKEADQFSDVFGDVQPTRRKSGLPRPKRPDDERYRHDENRQLLSLPLEEGRSGGRGSRLLQIDGRRVVSTTDRGLNSPVRRRAWKEP